MVWCSKCDGEKTRLEFLLVVATTEIKWAGERKKHIIYFLLMVETAKWATKKSTLGVFLARNKNDKTCMYVRTNYRTTTKKKKGHMPPPRRKKQRNLT